MKDLTIGDVIDSTQNISGRSLNLDYLISLEYALDALEIPWVKGIRITYRQEDDGIYYNKDVGENLVAVLADGITMPSLIDTKYGVELSEDAITHYSYEELFLRMVDVTGPKFAKLGIEKLKEIARLAIS